MDQTPLLFALADTNGKEVWCATRLSGFDKRQCTVQLAVFRDGNSQVSVEETNSGRTVAVFQVKVSCDGRIGYPRIGVYTLKNTNKGFKRLDPFWKYLQNPTHRH